MQGMVRRRRPVASNTALPMVVGVPTMATSASPLEPIAPNQGSCSSKNSTAMPGVSARASRSSASIAAPKDSAVAARPRSSRSAVVTSWKYTQRVRCSRMPPVEAIARICPDAPARRASLTMG